MKDKIIKPIAHIENNFPSKFGIPRQSGLANIRSKLIFEKEYSKVEAFKGLDGFSHLHLIWGFSENEREECSLTVRPPMLGGNERVGVFASRSPFRPNGLGLSVVKIDKFYLKEGRAIIEVLGADLMNGTPVYDVKPYLAYVDCIKDAKDGFATEKEGYRLDVTFSGECDRLLSSEQKAELIESLSRDPRPQYHEDGREYGLCYADKEIKFKVEGSTLTVVKVEDKNERR